MLVSFTVENFKSVRNKITLDLRASADKTHEDYYVFTHQKPKLRILKLAMIYGPNASGKTNILLALDFLRNIVIKSNVNKEEKIDRPSFALDKANNTVFEITFIENDTLFEYALVFDDNCIHSESLMYYPKGISRKVFTRKLKKKSDDQTEYNYDYEWTNAELKKSQKEFLEDTIHNQPILSKISSLKYEGPIQEAKNWFFNRMLKLLEKEMSLDQFFYKCLAKENNDCEKFKSILLEQIQKADLNISNLIYEEKEIKEEEIPEGILSFIKQKQLEPPKILSKSVISVHKIKGGTFSLNFKEESSGTQRFSKLLSLLIRVLKNNNFILMDEIENALHIDLIKHFLILFLRNNNQSQLIFTTHNTSLLGERDLIRRDTVYLCKKKEDSSTDLYSVSDFSVRKEHSIESLYRKGFLGALPSLGSTIMEFDDENKKR